jgi:hypothetical protein
MAATINIILLQNTDIYTVSKLQEHCFYLSLYLSLYIYIYILFIIVQNDDHLGN